MLAALADGDTEIRSKPSYAELEREVYVLREQVASLSAALAAKTAEFEQRRREQASAYGGVPELDASLAMTSLAPPRLSSPSFALAPGASVFRSLSLAVVEPEQREHTRVPCNLEVEFTVESEFYTGFTQDLSQGGLFVVTYCTFPIDTELTLRIELRTGEVVEVTGRVRWLREPCTEATRPGMGIEFVALPAHALEPIQRACRGREPLFFDVAALD